MEEWNPPAEFESALQYAHRLSDPSLTNECPSHGEMSVGETVRVIGDLSQTKSLLAALPGLAELPELREAPCQMASGEDRGQPSETQGLVGEVSRQERKVPAQIF